MRIVEYRKFTRAFKRLHKAEQRLVLDAIDAIVSDPAVGDAKKGDLAGYRVHKIKVGEQLKLLAYMLIGETLVLVAYGPHENFYRDLKA